MSDPEHYSPAPAALLASEALLRAAYHSPGQWRLHPVPGLDRVPRSEVLGANEGGARLRFDRRGFDNGDAARDRAGPRLAVLGDSFVEAAEVPREHNAVSRLAAALPGRGPAGRRSAGGRGAVPGAAGVLQVPRLRGGRAGAARPGPRAASLPARPGRDQLLHLRADQPPRGPAAAAPPAHPPAARLRCVFPVLPAHDLKPDRAARRLPGAARSRGAARAAAGVSERGAVPGRRRLQGGDRRIQLRFVEEVFAAPLRFDAAAAALAAAAYAVQIFGDFFGYSLMAAGLARASCCRAISPRPTPPPASPTSGGAGISRSAAGCGTTSASPLGGSRGGEARTARNLMPTMLLGGLWHSPAWSFVLWGVAHGARLAAERGRRRRFGPPRPGAWRRGLAVGGTAPAVCLLWVLFRAPGMDGTVAMFSAPVGFEGPNRWINP